MWSFVATSRGARRYSPNEPVGVSSGFLAFSCMSLRRVVDSVCLVSSFVATSRCAATSSTQRDHRRCPMVLGNFLHASFMLVGCAVVGAPCGVWLRAIHQGRLPTFRHHCWAMIKLWWLLRHLVIQDPWGFPSRSSTKLLGNLLDVVVCCNFPGVHLRQPPNEPSTMAESNHFDNIGGR